MTKLVLIGDGSTGKTSLLYSIMANILTADGTRPPNPMLNPYTGEQIAAFVNIDEPDLVTPPSTPILSSWPEQAQVQIEELRTRLVEAERFIEGEKHRGTQRLVFTNDTLLKVNELEKRIDSIESEMDEVQEQLSFMKEEAKQNRTKTDKSIQRLDELYSNTIEHLQKMEEKYEILQKRINEELAKLDKMVIHVTKTLEVTGHDKIVDLEVLKGEIHVLESMTKYTALTDVQIDNTIKGIYETLVHLTALAGSMASK